MKAKEKKDNGTIPPVYKVIGTASEMSNLVGMYAFVLEGKQIKKYIYICGKADNNHFICQAISPLTSQPNMAKLKTIEQMKEWIILPDAYIANYMYDIYTKVKEWNFETDF